MSSSLPFDPNDDSWNQRRKKKKQEDGKDGNYNDNDDDNSNSGIPIIDLSSRIDEWEISSQLLSAFTTIGFATLIHHGIDSELIRRAFVLSRAFFDLPVEIKRKYPFRGYASNRGYIAMGMETHESSSRSDRKETFDLGKEDDEETSEYSNPWPRELEFLGFRSTMISYFDAFDALHLRIMKLLAKALGLNDEDFFVKRCNDKHENLRLLHYPAILVHGEGSRRRRKIKRWDGAHYDGRSSSVEHDVTGTNEEENTNDDEPIVRGSVHTDFGTITLLSQDDVGGLRVQRIDGTWVNVPPHPGGIVVNVGDMLQRWTNDVLRATLHQVVETVTERDTRPAGAEQSSPQVKQRVVPERYSIAFFCNANKDTVLECLPQCTSEERPPKYSPINAYDYLTMRLSQTISPNAMTSTSSTLAD